MEAAGGGGARKIGAESPYIVKTVDGIYNIW